MYKNSNYNKENYDSLSYSQDELAEAMRHTYDELINFVSTPKFQEIFSEFSNLGNRDRLNFVVSVLLNEEELRIRSLHVPEGILIQRSAFGDRRPTLFCVKKYLPERFRDVWQNVNITFDNKFADDSVLRSPEVSWREPLPVNKQAEIMASGGDLEQVG